MSVKVNTELNMFLQQQAKALRTVRKNDDREKAMEAFSDAMAACDKAIGKVVDDHHKTVAESAKKREKYLKQKAQAEKSQEIKDKQELMNERMLIHSINHRAMIQGMRVEDQERHELLMAERYDQ